MGNSNNQLFPIPDQYKKIEEVKEAILKSGLGECELVIGIDFTLSNLTQGRKTFDGNSLHTISKKRVNPYQEVISIIGGSLAQFDEDNSIPVYIFGCKLTKGKKVRSLSPNGPCKGLHDVLEVYGKQAPEIEKSGPTNFAPLIRKTIEDCCESGKTKFHILLIIADGQVDKREDTINALIEASMYPISIVTIGVGDGPFGINRKFDDEIPKRLFDNYQFVDFQKCVKKAKKSGIKKSVQFAIDALMEVPEQYSTIKKLGLLGKKTDGKKLLPKDLLRLQKLIKKRKE